MKEPSEQGAQMTPEQLWDKHLHNDMYATKAGFLAAIKEYGEAVRAEAVKVCNTVESVKWNIHLSGKPTTLKCSDAIKDMKLP